MLAAPSPPPCQPPLPLSINIRVQSRRQAGIPPFPLEKGCGARSAPGPGDGSGQHRPQPPPETPLGEKKTKKQQQKYLLNSSINVQINTFGPVSRGGRSHLATAGLSPRTCFQCQSERKNQVYPTQPSHRWLPVWCPRSSVSHCTLILGRSLL